MKVSEQMKKELEQLKNQAKSLLAEKKVDEAENKTLDIKILSAKLEVQEKLDEATEQLEGLNNQITNLKTELETANNEKTEIMDKFNNATETATKLKEKVEAMTPIVEQYNEEQYNNKLNTAKEDYKNKFEKCDAVDIFESEEVQNLVVETIDEDETVSTKAKYALSEKLLNALDSGINNMSIKNIQEPTKETKNLKFERNDEFEAMYGFKKQ